MPMMDIGQSNNFTKFVGNRKFQLDRATNDNLSKCIKSKVTLGFGIISMEAL